MALSEIQLPDKQRFYNDMQRLANELSRHMASWELGADFINDVTAADLTAMGITDSASITSMTDLRNVMNELVSLYNGEDVSPAKNPQSVIDSVRKMLPI